MATSFEHRALVEQLRALTSKRAENPGEKILNTSHPSGDNSAADDHTRPAVVGHRYQENSADNKKMYPAGTDSDTKNEAGGQQKDPGHNKGLHPRPTGEAPEVERKYNLNDHNDPGTGHPSGKAAADFINEARGLAAELRNLIKASAGDAYVTGTAPEVAKNTKKDNASGTAAYPVNAENDGNIEIPEDSGKNAAEIQKIAELRFQANQELRSFKEEMKEAAARDAASFASAVVTIMDKFAAPHVLPAIKQAQAAEAKRIKVAAVKEAMEKIAVFDALAEVDGAPKFAEVIGAVEAKAKNKKPDGDGDGVPDWADKAKGEDDHEMKSDEKAAFARALRKLAEEMAEAEESSNKTASKKGAGSRNGGTFRKASEEMMEEEAEEGAEDAEEISQDEEMAAEEALADMAAMPAESPDAAAMMACDPMGGEESAPLGPEEEAALMALMQQEGMKESDVKAYAKIASNIASGKLKVANLSEAQKAFVSTCDVAVKRAGAKFQTLRSASRLRNELNSIYRGIQ